MMQNQYVCMATKLKYEIEDAGVHETLKYSLTNGLPKKAIKAFGNQEVQQNYWTHEGRMLMFDQKDPTVASIMHSKVHHDYQYNKVDTDSFDPFLFDSQFLKYAQILDTDYENYILLYTCQETAEFTDNE